MLNDILTPLVSCEIVFRDYSVPMAAVHGNDGTESLVPIPAPSISFKFAEASPDRLIICVLKKLHGVCVCVCVHCV